LRPNLLRIGLAMLEDHVPGDSPEGRAAVLESLLGNRDLADTYLRDIRIERINLEGWDLQRLRGEGGSIRYCPGLDRAFFDETISTVDTEGCEIPRLESTEIRIAKGRSRLIAVLNECTNHSVS